MTVEAEASLGVRIHERFKKRTVCKWPSMRTSAVADPLPRSEAAAVLAVGRLEKKAWAIEAVHIAPADATAAPATAVLAVAAA